MKHFKVYFHTTTDSFVKDYTASSKLDVKEQFLHDICQTSFLLIYVIDLIIQVD